MYKKSYSDRAVIYARVSVAHDNKKDMTIENQIMISEKYIENNHFIHLGTYTDKGYSGRNFNRPEWNKLTSDALKGKFDILIVKDLSRIGRNYIETGEFIEKFFLSHNIRVISVSEGYDSFSITGDSLSFGLKNVINEWYARESGRKVSAVKQYKKSQGEYVGSVAPYGYKTDYLDGKRIVVNDDSICIVNTIKKMKEEGYTSSEIASWLSKNHINTPSEYRKTGKIYCQDYGVYKKWDSGSVRRLWNKCDSSAK